MINLREASESALGYTLEGLWALPVELTSPEDGIARLYEGQVMFSFTEENPDGGEPLIIKIPAVTLRISSLILVPQANENWFVRIPDTPSRTAALVPYTLEGTRAPKSDDSLGIITIFLKKVVQK